MGIPTLLDVAEAPNVEPPSDPIEEMEPADSADVLDYLPTEQSVAVLGQMEESEAEEVRQLLTHPEDTWVGIMTSRVVAVKADITVAEGITHLRQQAEDELFYLYAVV